MRYEVVDANGDVVNVVIWDGESQFDVGDGLTLRESPLPEPDADDEELGESDAAV